MDQRCKKLERYLKLALLKAECGNNSSNRMQQAVRTSPSISSITVDTTDSNCPSSLQISCIESEVLASSKNLKGMLPRKRTYNTNKEVLATSSVKQYNIQQDNDIDRRIMPPPTVNRVYHTSKATQDRVYVSSECKKSSTPLNYSIQSCTSKHSLKSPNTYNDKEYLHSCIPSTTLPKDVSRPENVFSRWKVMLNNQYQLRIKGTLECGRVVRSKPVIRRLSATHVESIFKHQYHLHGNIADDRNELPDYIRGKFYNGFPDDWENVYQIWRTFVSQGSLVTFRWPTPITDSDDDLKSEITDSTYTYWAGDKSNPPISSYNTIKNAGQVIQSKSPTNQSLENVEKYHNGTHISQSYGKDRTFVKTFVSAAEKEDASPACTASHTSNEENKQNTRTSVNQPCSPRKTNKLKDFLQEDKLKIIINNLADRNCSREYIDKILEMFDCLNYVMSYKSEAECDINTTSENSSISRSEVISLQQSPVFNKDYCMANKLEHQTEPRSHVHSSDLGYGSIRNDIESSQVGSNVRDNVDKPEYGNREDSDESESKIYAGVLKIAIERLVQGKEVSRKLPKRKVKKRMTRQPDQQTHAANEQHDLADAKHEFAVHSALPTADIQKKSPPFDESCASITEEEVETPKKTRTCHEAANFTWNLREAAFRNHQLLQITNADVHAEDTADPVAQRNTPKQRLDFFHPQEIKLNVFTKGKNPRDAQEKLQFTDIDDISSLDVVTNTRKTSESTAAESHANLRRDVAIVNDKKDNLPEKSCTSRESRKEFVQPPTGEATFIRSKPTVISSVPVKLNIKLTRAVAQKSAMAYDLDVGITNDDETTNAHLTEKTLEKPVSAPKESIVAKPAFATSEFLKKTIDNKKENRATSSTAVNTKNGLISTSPTDARKSITKVSERSKKPNHKEDAEVLTAWVPKVVHDAASKSKLGLTFQGKLLNEVGHIVHRNFTTEIVLRRLSPTLIETVNHKFYQLLGSLNDNKHVIPKELLRQCRYGCPSRIEQFCLTWKLSQHVEDEVEKVEKKLCNASIESLNVPVSSRGRRILPPLCYWTGERLTLKDNTPVYSFGNLQASSLTLLNKSPKKNTEKNEKQQMDSKNMKKNSVTKQKPLPEINAASDTNKNQTIVLDKISPESPEAEVANGTKKFQKPTANRKRKLAQKLTFSSTDSDYEEERQVSVRRKVMPKSTWKKN